MQKRQQDLISIVNSLAIDDFRSSYAQIDHHDALTTIASGKSSYGISLQSSSCLTQAEVRSCFALIEATSRHDYESSSIGWRPQRKMREMLQSDLKYILVKSCEQGPSSLQETAVEGFLSFMATHDSIPSSPVLYIYEIHLTDKHRGKGLGKHLMETAELVAQRIGVMKVMLTCFLSNQDAMRFYHRLGYQPDACSPEERKTRNKVIKPDYAILSKEIFSSEARKAV